MDRVDRALDRDGAVAYLEGLSRFGIRLGLERMAFLLDALGHPERRLRILHVAGTNGKGSTCAMLTAILQAAGYRTGLYTSPHLVRYEERIRLDGAPIPGGRLAALIDRLKGIIDRAVREGLEHPTEFEVGTAAMYAYFAEAGAEVVVQETGLGGRFDATNLVAAPLVSVITPIGLDHRDRLGDTPAAIAAEKAGIIKAGVPVVSAPQPPEAAAVLAEAAARAGSRLVRVGAESCEGAEVCVRGVEASAEATRLDYRGLAADLPGLRLGLLGRHQAANAACALAAAELLRERGLDLPEAALRAGLAAARWPARLEVLARRPLLVLDGAHNPDGAAALRRALGELWPRRRFILIAGVLADKDVGGIVAELAAAAVRAVATRPPSPRALPPEDLARRLEAAGCPAEVQPDPAAAVARALALAGPEGAVCAAGSLYLAGEVRRLFASDG